jgi:hypothetical protein
MAVVFKVRNLFFDEVKVQLPAGVNQEMKCLTFMSISTQNKRSRPFGTASFKVTFSALISG